MGIQGTSNFTAYNNWTQNYSTGKTTDSFKFSSPDEKEYSKNLDELADGWIKNYDSDGDGKVTFEEYAYKELAELKNAIASGSIKMNSTEIDSVMNTLINTFLRLNVDDENNSKDVITKTEAMNFFYTMDSLDSAIQGENGVPKPDGNINGNELAAMADTLGADKVQGNEPIYKQREAIFGLLLDNYDRKFKTF